MKVAQICTNAMSGSVGKIARDLSSALNNLGDESILYYSRGREFKNCHARRFGSRVGVYTSLSMARLFDSDGLHAKEDTRRLIDYLKEWDPDIIHLHCLHGYYVNYKELFDYINYEQKKVVWTMHDCWAFTGHCAFYDYVDCNKWVIGCENCPQKNEYPKSVLFDRSKRNYEIKRRVFLSIPSQNMRIITPSEWLAKEIKKSFLSEYSITIINNDVDYTVFRTDKENRIEKRILGVANIWNRRKGLNDFIELSKVIPKDYHILIVGASDEQINLLSQYGIKAVKRTSNQDELADLYRTSTILFNPTYEDNYPTVNVEAVACGLPVVTYDTGGSPEIIRKTGLGVVVQKKDYQSVVSYLESAYRRNPTILNFKNSMTEKYLAIYNNLVEES